MITEFVHTLPYPIRAILFFNLEIPLLILIVLAVWALGLRRRTAIIGGVLLVVLYVLLKIYLAYEQAVLAGAEDALGEVLPAFANSITLSQFAFALIPALVVYTLIIWALRRWRGVTG